MEVLPALLSPDWEGGYLLVSWYGHDNLAGWMRLTSIVSDWQRLTHR